MIGVRWAIPLPADVTHYVEYRGGCRLFVTFAEMEAAFRWGPPKPIICGTVRALVERIAERRVQGLWEVLPT